MRILHNTAYLYTNTISYLTLNFCAFFDRNERRRQPDHRIVVRTSVYAEPVQLVCAGQPPRHRRRRNRRTPSDAAYESDPDKSAARAHTHRLHERPDESHFGRLLPAPTDAPAVLHVVLIAFRRLTVQTTTQPRSTHNPPRSTTPAAGYHGRDSRIPAHQTSARTAAARHKSRLGTRRLWFLKVLNFSSRISTGASPATCIRK